MKLIIPDLKIMGLKIMALLWLLMSNVASAGVVAVEMLPVLAQAVSNNAVTAVVTDRGLYLYSFMGLGRGKTWQDITAATVVLEPGANAWKTLLPVPGELGRLASSAVSVAGAAWLFGGYTVTPDGAEVSTPGVYRIRPGEAGVQWLTDMPVPVDDTVVLAYQDRYVYLISGWHDLGNVNLVQVLDTQTLKWAQATPWPGVPVFGHAGGISGAQLLVCDGVKIRYPEKPGPREFLLSAECWQGEINSKNFRRIDWRPLPVHPGAPRYRMAASGDDDGHVVFAGGATNPYNYDGIGYNGVPASAEKSVFSYNFKTAHWQVEGDLPQGTMDHRGLGFAAGWYYLVGGMHAGQTPVADVVRFRVGKNRVPLP